MKLWVDDIRTEPEGWTGAHSVTEAIRILDTMEVEEVSIDHDISMKVSVGTLAAGYGAARPFVSNETYEPVARFIARAYAGKPLAVRIHTANLGAAARMQIILAEFLPTVRL